MSPPETSLWRPLLNQIKGISICFLGKGIRPLCKSLIPYPINSDDPEQEHWIIWSLTMNGSKITVVRWSDDYHYSIYQSWTWRPTHRAQAQPWWFSRLLYVYKYINVSLQSRTKFEFTSERCPLHPCLSSKGRRQVLPSKVTSMTWKPLQASPWSANVW